MTKAAVAWGVVLKVMVVAYEQVVELDGQHKEDGQTHLKVAAVVCR